MKVPTKYLSTYQYGEDHKVSVNNLTNPKAIFKKSLNYTQLIQ